MDHWALFLSLIVIPVVFGILPLIFSSPWKTLLTAIAGVFITSIFGWWAVYTTFSHGPIFGFRNWLFLDDLSAFNLAVLLIVFTLTSLFALRYFAEELQGGHLRLPQIRVFAGLWAPALGAMVLVLISNNLGIMWVGMEATTLLTSFMICIHLTRESLEAMWKYMLVCSVGITFAFLGTLMVRLAATDLALDSNQALLWTNLLANAGSLSQKLVKAAFIFLLVGYGTKAGLAPMHCWLPDAHSKAPAPVSAVFSGFMLNTALYCVMRYVPIIDAATGHTGWPLKFLVGFGLLSILISSAFILSQHDLKRFLAYCSVEHLGIITLGFGLGGLGSFAALFHTLNHSLCKTIAFFAAGRLGQIFGTHDMGRMTGSCRVAPVWGVGIFVSILALIGVAPFCIFMSEFLILKAAVGGGQLLVAFLFLMGTGTVFAGALGHAIPLALGDAEEGVEQVPPNFIDLLLIVLPLIALLILGLWMPDTLQLVMARAAAVIQGVPVLTPGEGLLGGGH